MTQSTYSDESGQESDSDSCYANCTDIILDVGGNGGTHSDDRGKLDIGGDCVEDGAGGGEGGEGHGNGKGSAGNGRDIDVGRNGGDCNDDVGNVVRMADDDVLHDMFRCWMQVRFLLDFNLELAARRTSDPSGAWRCKSKCPGASSMICSATSAACSTPSARLARQRPASFLLFLQPQTHKLVGEAGVSGRGHTDVETEEEEAASECSSCGGWRCSICGEGECARRSQRPVSEQSSLCVRNWEGTLQCLEL